MIGQSRTGRRHETRDPRSVRVCGSLARCGGARSASGESRLPAVRRRCASFRRTRVGSAAWPSYRACRTRRDRSSAAALSSWIGGGAILSVKIPVLARLVQSGAAVSMIGQSRTRPAARNKGSTVRSSVRITGPMRRRSISQRREPASHWPPALRIMLSNSRGQRSVTHLPSVPNSTGPILGGTGQGARMK